MLRMRFNIAKRIIAKLRTKVNSGFDVFADRKTLHLAGVEAERLIKEDPTTDLCISPTAKT